MIVETEYELHQKVTIKEISRPGIVIAIILDSRGTQYQVVFWHNGKRESVWMFGFELEKL
jgi:hypothetical protein